MEEAKRNLQELWDVLQIIMKGTKPTTKRKIAMVYLASEMLDIIDKYPNLSEEVLGFDALEELKQIET